MKKLCAVILNYRRAALTIGCLEALESEVAPYPDRCAIVIDNGSDDDSATHLEEVIRQRAWGSWLTLVRSPANRGFAGGNNLGVQSIPAESYLLLNSDARVMPGSLSAMLEALRVHPRVGAVGPRLEGPDGQPQVSCFRYRTPISEFLEAAGTGPLDRVFHNRLVALKVVDTPIEPPWLSFACILIRKAVIDEVGPMDEGYFMYFEDIDYSRRMRAAGWRILYWPQARVVHLRGGTSAVKAALKARTRVPRYYFESRSRYFAKFYGGVAGLWMTNLLWLAGRALSWVRERLAKRARGACELEARDNWTNWLRPLRAPAAQRGGEL